MRAPRPRKASVAAAVDVPSGPGSKRGAAAVRRHHLFTMTSVPLCVQQRLRWQRHCQHGRHASPAPLNLHPPRLSLNCVQPLTCSSDTLSDACCHAVPSQHCPRCHAATLPPLLHQVDRLAAALEMDGIESLDTASLHAALGLPPPPKDTRGAGLDLH